MRGPLSSLKSFMGALLQSSEFSQNFSHKTETVGCSEYKGITGTEWQNLTSPNKKRAWLLQGTLLLMQSSAQTDSAISGAG